jgi:hypothetical protein
MALAVLALAAAQASAETAPKWHQNGHELTSQHVPVNIWGEFKMTSEALGEATGQEGELHCTNVIGASLWNEGGHAYGALEGWGTNACKAPQLESLLEKFYEGQIKKEVIKTPITVFATGELPVEKVEREGEVCEEGKPLFSECPNADERERDSKVIWHIRRAVSSLPWKLELVKAVREEANVTVAKIGIPSSGTTCYPKEKVIEHGVEYERSASYTKVPSGCIRITVISPQIPDELVFYGTLEPTFVSGAGNGLNPSKFEFGQEGVSGQLKAEREEAPDTSVQGELKIAGALNEQLIFAK